MVGEVLDEVVVEVGESDKGLLLSYSLELASLLLLLVLSGPSMPSP